MKKLAQLAAVVALAVAVMAPGLASARAQQLDPTVIDGLTEAINKRDPQGVVSHFAEGGTITFDNSLFGAPNETIVVAEYASRFQPNNPDVPADIRMEVAPGSLQISGDRASWTWRQTASFLTNMGIDYIETTVVATVENGKFKSLTIAPTRESLTKLPYSPGTVTGVVPSVPGMPRTGSGPDEMALISLTLVAAGMVLAGLRMSRSSSQV